MKSNLIRKRSSIALVSLLVLAIMALPSAVGAAAGDLDPSFGSGGKVVTDVGFGSAQALLVQPNGKLVVAGYRSSGDFLLVRYLPNGSLDPIFAGDGVVTTDFGRYEEVGGVAFRLGELVVAGGTVVPLHAARGPTSPVLAHPAVAVARYRLDGSLDPTFGGDGTILIDFDGRAASARDVALQDDGKVIVVGWTNSGSLTGDDFALARFNHDGSLDPTFGAGGLVVTDFGSDADRGEAVVLQPDGHIVVVGRTGSFTGGEFAGARYEPDGSLDQSFDDDGKMTIDYGGGQDFALDLAVQSDSKMVVVGATQRDGGDFDFALARLNVDGSLDAQGLDPYLDSPFGTGGRVTTDFAGGDDLGTSVALERSGKIVVVGHATPAPGTERDFGLVRYNVDGSLDTSFGTAGKVTTSVTSEEDLPAGVVIQRDDRIVLAGTAAGNAFDFALARYLVSPCCTAGGSPPGGPPDPGPGPLP